MLETALDKGHGACVLRDQRVAQIVADSLLHFDGHHLAESVRDCAAESRSDSATMTLKGRRTDPVAMLR